MTIQINGITYDALKMPPRQQFHVMRRLAPLMSAAAGAVMGFLDESKAKEEVFKEIASSIGPLADVISSLPDEQLDYVLDNCLLNVKRLDGDKWFPIYVAQPRGALRMYQDIDAGAEMRLVAEVVKVNLAGFFGPLSDGSASSLSAAEGALKG